MSKYFDKFPLINYNGSVVRNILAKVDFTETSKRDIYSSFDFILTEESSRSDLLSEVHYNSPMYDWLIYLRNNIVDPYYDYYMNDLKLNEYIKSKYGSYAAAESNILYYRNNWAPDDSTIDETLYDTLDNAIQKYYRPVVGGSNEINGYVRINEDWVVSTNKIVDLYLDDTSNYSVGDRITQASSGAQGTIIKVEETLITIQHVNATFEVGVLGATNIINVVLIHQVIPEIESAFWAPVSAYEMEAEKNELKKYISLIKSSYLPDIEKLFNEQIKK